jgi:hypothetical protein
MEKRSFALLGLGHEALNRLGCGRMPVAFMTRRLKRKQSEKIKMNRRKT